MYDMYPEAWTAADERRSAAGATARPRRRARKSHSVLPPVLTVPATTGDAGHPVR
jgi:hypothetical protein